MGYFLSTARLPFQVISSPRTESDKASGGIKRKLSESDDIQITKVVKAAVVEEIKENAIQDELKTGMRAVFSSLFTSKIINNCTEPPEEVDVSLQKGATIEGIPPKSPEVQSVSAEDSNKKKVLSKNILDKLSSWKKSPPKNEPITKKESVVCKKSPSRNELENERETLEYSDGKTSEQAVRSDTLVETPTTASEVPSEPKCDIDASSSAELPEIKVVDSTSSEEKLSLSAAAIENPEGQNQNSNHSTDNSIVEVDLDAESDNKKEDLNGGTPLASPKVPRCEASASPRTPKGLSGLVKPKLTPKQLARLKEAARKQEEKDRIKIVSSPIEF